MRLSSVHIITGISCVFFATAGFRVASHSSSDFTAEAQTAEPSAVTAAQLHAVSASIPVSTKPAPGPLAAPGTEIYTAKRGEAIPTIARRYLGRTSYPVSYTHLDVYKRQIPNRSIYYDAHTSTAAPWAGAEASRFRLELSTD